MKKLLETVVLTSVMTLAAAGVTVGIAAAEAPTHAEKARAAQPAAAKVSAPKAAAVKRDSASAAGGAIPDARALRSRGRNPYFVLEPGNRLTYEGREQGRPVRVVATVLAETRRVAGVETRVVEERETVGGALRELSRNYFAIDSATATLYYFGEDVDEHGPGKAVSHGGSWLAGAKGARPGVAMPGRPAVGDRFAMEVAPGTAMDRFEIVSLDETVRTPAGTFRHCLKTLETTPLEPGVKESKWYAPGVGLVVDGGLRLVKADVRRGEPAR
jgi:hypothetical protein